MEVVARKRKRETAMEDVDFRRWGDMEPDILSEIFKRLGRISDLTSAIVYVRCSAVCSTWRSVILDYSSRVFTTLDLLRMKIDFIPSQYKPYVYVTSKSDLALSHVLKVSLGFSMGNITSLLFNRNLYVPDHLLIYEAERCPKLRRLVLPDWNRITKTGMCKALGC
ncbi:F-box/LRR-repeat protein At3g48880-like [Pyrus communis]|uniref:F-box/LRR-repeat protein At3g48880-like n=1 Tax=Pyrus communis TaxID=23211 RepID=UPI0035C1E8BD